METKNNRSLLAEKSDIRLKAAGNNIVYMDESHHHKGKSRLDKNKKGVKQPISKSERIIIIHAGNEKGFVPGALLLDKCLDSDGDNHHAINADTYQT